MYGEYGPAAIIAIIAVRHDDIYPMQLRCEPRGRKALHLHVLAGDAEYRAVTIVPDSDCDMARQWHYADKDQSRLSMVRGVACLF